MAMLAHTYLAVTLAEIRRLLAHLTRFPAQAYVWAWSRWRRRHQHRAKPATIDDVTHLTKCG
ncbi:hypothetical protein Amsp01_044150 [Amycolatopsis sp. NBRC 101858]|nr:hypothetical protein Amsp01_044150 [Amycolatopsis sp. NBRC 101858]